MKNLPDLELFSAYLDGELTAEQQAQMERLLATSAEARQLLEELRMLSQSLQRLPTHKVPEDLTPQIFQEASRRRLRVSPPMDSPIALSAGDAVSGQILSIPTPPSGDSSQLATPVGGLAQESAKQIMPRPKSYWEPLFRRLFNPRGLMWSSVAVAVAVAIWVWRPSLQDRSRQVAKAPQGLPSATETVPSKPLALEENMAPASEEDQENQQKHFDSRASGESVIRARSATSKPVAHLPEKGPGLTLGDDLATVKDRSIRHRSETGADAAKGDLSPAPPLAVDMAQSLPEEKASSPRGKGPIALSEPFWDLTEGDGDKELARRKEFRASGALQAGKAPPLGPEGPAPVAPKNQTTSLAKTEKEPETSLLTKSGRKVQDIRGNVPLPPPGAPPGQESMHSGASATETRVSKPSAPSLAEQPPASPPALASRKQDGVASPEMAATPTKEAGVMGTPLQQGVLPQEQILTQLVSETITVVICDVSGSAFQQQTLEQILSSQQIFIHQEEEVLKDLWEAERAIEGLLPDSPEKLRSAEESPGRPTAGQAISEGPAGEGASRTASGEKKSLPVLMEADRPPPRGFVPPPESPKGAPSTVFGESSLQFMLVEATPQQVEETLKALHARPEQFLALWVIPAPKDPSQHFYQQYNRADRPGARTPSGAPWDGRAFQGIGVPSLPSKIAPGSAMAQQGLPSSSAPGSPPTSALGPPTPSPGESQKEKDLIQRSQELASAKSLGTGAGGKSQFQQDFRDQQGWARRLRVPEHLSRQFWQTREALPLPEQILPIRASPQTPSLEALEKYSEKQSSSAGERLAMDSPIRQHQGAGAGFPEGKIMSAPPSELEKAPPSAVPREVPPLAKGPSDGAGRAGPPPSLQVHREAKENLDTHQATPIPDQPERSSLSEGTQSPKRVRVLFVLRPGENPP